MEVAGLGECQSEASKVAHAAPISRDRTGKLPTGTGERPILGFATLSHSNLKSWAKVQAAQGHNTRTLDTPNARKDAPAPIELLEEKSGPYVERVKGILVEHKVPVKIRKGGVIACEDIYGASPEYWNRDGSWRDKSTEEIRSDPVVLAAVALARRTYGAHLVSCALHLDEESPHVHVIHVPLVERAHAKRGKKPKSVPRDENGKPLSDPRPKVVKWSLDCSAIRGLSSQMEKNHDDWAEACEPFHLIRGAKGSSMTKEQHRARRNRQTGRSSHAEMDARKERERLHGELEAELERTAKLQKEAEEAKKRLDAAEAATREAEARASAREAAADLKLADLAIAEEKARKREEAAKEKQTLYEKLTSGFLNQLRLIGRLLDPKSGAKLHLGDNGPEAEGLDEEDRAAVQSSFDWLPGGVASLARTFSTLIAREEHASRQEQAATVSLQEANKLMEEAAEERRVLSLEREESRLQLEIVRKSLQADSGVGLQLSGSEVRLTGISEEEQAALSRGPKWLKSGLRNLLQSISSLSVKSKLLDQGQRTLETKHAKADELLAQINNDKAVLETTWAAISRTNDRAIEFTELWLALPEDQRSPNVSSALKAAEGLSSEDLPPGYSLPGQGGGLGRA